MTIPKVTNFIYDLILKMTPSERRYFKLSSHQHTQNRKKTYLDLFDIITSQQKSDWKGESPVKKEFLLKFGNSRFDLIKLNLYGKLLQSLEAYHKKSHVSLLVRSMLNQSGILNRKGLPYQALSLIKKIKTKCKKYELWYLLLEALELERNIMYAVQNPSTSNKEEKKTLEKALELSDFRDLQSQLWKTYILHGLPTDPATRSLYQKLKLEIEEKAKSSIINSFEANLIFLYCQQFIAGMEGNIQKTYSFGTTLLQTMDAHSEFMNDKIEMYIRTLINLQYAQIRLFKSREVVESREKCLKILNESSVAPTFKFSIRVALFANQYDMGFKEKKLTILPPIINALRIYVEESQHLMNPATELIFNWQMAIHHFVFEEYNKTLEYNNRIIQMKSPYRNDIKALARLMNLIVYFEMDQLQLLRPFTLNTYRYLKNKQRLHPIENFLIDFIRKDLAKHHFFRSLDYAFKSSYQKLIQLKGSNDSHETLMLMYFEYWLEKKIIK